MSRDRLHVEFVVRKLNAKEEYHRLLVCLLGGENSKASSSKTKQSPSTSKQSFAQRLLQSDDESNSSGADFEPTPKRTPTPRRQTRSSRASSHGSSQSSTEKRVTRSSAKKLEESVEDVSDVSRSTVGDEKECCCDDPAEPIETSATLPDPPSPSLLEDIHENESHSDAVSSKIFFHISRNKRVLGDKTCFFSKETCFGWETMFLSLSTFGKHG